MSRSKGGRCVKLRSSITVFQSAMGLARFAFAPSDRRVAMRTTVRPSGPGDRIQKMESLLPSLIHGEALNPGDKGGDRLTPSLL